MSSNRPNFNKSRFNEVILRKLETNEKIIVGLLDTNRQACWVMKEKLYVIENLISKLVDDEYDYRNYDLDGDGRDVIADWNDKLIKWWQIFADAVEKKGKDAQNICQNSLRSSSTNKSPLRQQNKQKCPENQNPALPSPNEIESALRRMHNVNQIAQLQELLQWIARIQANFMESSRRRSDSPPIRNEAEQQQQQQQQKPDVFDEKSRDRLFSIAFACLPPNEQRRFRFNNSAKTTNTSGGDNGDYQSGDKAENVNRFWPSPPPSFEELSRYIFSIIRKISTARRIIERTGDMKWRYQADGFNFCFYCKELGHFMPDCPTIKNSICFRCFQTGHKARCCIRAKPC